MPDNDKCPDCGRAIRYWEANCGRCGHFLGFPNRRAAVAEHDHLLKRATAARDEARLRGLAPLLAKLETLAEQSRPVIAMAFEVCDDILRSKKYRNYDRRVDSGEREPAKELDHADRQTAGGRLFPMYDDHIH
jgi:hypothetical protein